MKIRKLQFWLRKPVIITTCLLLAGAASTPLQASDHEKVEQMFRRSMNVDVTAIHNPAFKVFKRQLYVVEYTMFAGNDNFSPGSDYRLYVSGEQLVPVIMPGTDMKLGYFDDLIDPEFRLNAETALDFMAALKGVFDDRFFDTIQGKAIRQVDGKWQFLTGTFFDNMKGFVVSTDPDGHISAVHYRLKL